MWQMLVDTADAANWTAEEVEAAGIATGIFTENEIKAFEAQVRMNGLYQAGLIGVTEYTGVTLALAETAGEHGAAAVKQAEYINDTAEAAGEMNDRFGETPLEVTTHVYTPELPHAYSLATNYMSTLLNVPKSVSTTFTTHFITSGIRSAQLAHQDNVPELAAGTDYVPQTGFALLHQGEAVLPTDEAAAYRGGGMGGIVLNGGIHVSGVSDPEMAAAAVMRQLQDRGMFSGSALR